jgi:oxygen-independent coproporphyrinogen-3 oxidase
MMEEVQSIIGLGCGAVSRFVWSESSAEGKRMKIERLANPKDPRSYILQIEAECEKKLKKLEEIDTCQPVV